MSYDWATATNISGKLNAPQVYWSYYIGIEYAENYPKNANFYSNPISLALE